MTTTKKKATGITLTATKQVTFDIAELRDMLSEREMQEMITDAQVIAWAKSNKSLQEDLFYDSDFTDTKIEVLVV